MMLARLHNQDSLLFKETHMNWATRRLSAVILGVVLTGGIAEADTIIATFDENYYPINPVNNFGAFTFADFVAPGAFTDGPTSLLLNVTDTNGVNGVYGGVGVDYGTGSGPLVPIDFDPTSAYWELRIKITDSEADALHIAMFDRDGPGSADEYFYEFDLTGVPVDGQFHSLFKAIPNWLFSQTPVAFLPGDGVLNPGLGRITILSVLGSTEPLRVEIDHATIWAAVPEPSALALLTLGSLVMLQRRRKGTAARR
jgi:hypothetical protein